MSFSNKLLNLTAFSPATGVVSLEISGLTTMDMGRYTASFTTPLGMFDTKVHFDFTGSGKITNF